jgi:hypothetical protein
MKIKGQINIPPKKLDINTLEFDNIHTNTERHHNVTREEAISFIKNASLSISKWNGTFEIYYSPEGIVYVDLIKNIIRTAYKKEEFLGETIKIIEKIAKNNKN